MSQYEKDSPYIFEICDPFSTCRYLRIGDLFMDGTIDCATRFNDRTVLTMHDYLMANNENYRVVKYCPVEDVDLLSLRQSVISNDDEYIVRMTGYPEPECFLRLEKMNKANDTIYSPTYNLSGIPDAKIEDATRFNKNNIGQIVKLLADRHHSHYVVKHSSPFTPLALT